MKSRLIVTHRKPHLDEVGGIWLLRLYGGEAKTKLHFIRVDTKGAVAKIARLEEKHEVIALGVGLGKFDEHRGIDKSSCLLVWEDLKPRLKLDPVEERAVEKIVNWINAEDTATIGPVPYREFGIHNVLEGYFELKSASSQAVVRLGSLLLDTLLVRMRDFAAAEIDWEKRIEFSTIWGKGVGVKSDKRDVSTIAYRQGFVVVICVNPIKGHRFIGAPKSSSVNLTEVYEAVKKREPTARWYLHHSKRLLLSGSDLAENKALSKLSVEELIDIVKAVR